MAGLGEVPRAVFIYGRESEHARRFGNLHGGVGWSELDRTIGGEGERRGGSEHQSSAIHVHEISQAAVAEMGIRGELQAAGGDRHRSGEDIGSRQRHGTGGGLEHAPGTRHLRRHRTSPEQKIRIRYDSSRAATDLPRIQRHDGSLLRVDADIEVAAADRDRGFGVEVVVATDGQRPGVNERSAGISAESLQQERAVARLGEAAGGIRGGERRYRDGSPAAAAADQVELGHRTGDIGPRISDDDADHLAGGGIDHRISLGGRASRQHALGTETDEGRTDIAGTTDQGHVRLRDLYARGSPDGGLDGHIEARRINGQPPGKIRRSGTEAGRGTSVVAARLVINRAIQDRINDSSLDGRGQERAEIAARQQRAARRREIDRVVGGHGQIGRKISPGAERPGCEIDEGLRVGIVAGTGIVSDLEGTASGPHCSAREIQRGPSAIADRRIKV